jgi:hexosaminidase
MLSQALLVALSAGVPLDPDDVHPLLPTPFSFSKGLQTLAVDSNFAFVVSAGSSSEVLNAATKRYKGIIFGM